MTEQFVGEDVIKDRFERLKQVLDRSALLSTRPALACSKRCSSRDRRGEIP